MYYKQGINKKDAMRHNANYVFYVSDMEEIPSRGHFTKMDGGREIASHIAEGLDNCTLKKYTEYEGEVIRGESVGIVFPTHMWGISLAVYTFLKHLRVSTDTYVYAVAVGESLSGSVDATITKRINFVDRFKKIFSDRGFGDERHIYLRCIDFARNYGTVEEGIRECRDIRHRLECIMSGLLFHTINELSADDILTGEQTEAELVFDISAVQKASYDYVQRKLSLSNIFLDDDVLQGVKLCRVM